MSESTTERVTEQRTNNEEREIAGDPLLVPLLPALMSEARPVPSQHSRPRQSAQGRPLERRAAGGRTPLELRAETESEFSFYLLKTSNTARTETCAELRGSDTAPVRSGPVRSACLRVYSVFHTATLVHRCQLVTGHTHTHTHTHTLSDSSCVRRAKADSSRVAEPADVTTRRLQTNCMNYSK